MYNKLMNYYFDTDEEISKKLIRKLIEKRKQLKLSQKILAEKAGISYRTIQTIEAGNNLNLLTLIAILRALGEIKMLNSFLTEEVISPKIIHQKGK